MHTAVAILRGINVSGQKQIKMTDLQQLCSTIGLQNVRTYIQSGNVIFDTELTDARVIQQKIEQKIAEVYGFTVPVLIKTKQELEHVVHTNPFIKQPAIDSSKLHVTFLATAPAQKAVDALLAVDYLPDEWIVIGKEVYLHCPDGYGRTKLTNTFFEKKFATAATTRNWKTVNELLRLCV